MNKQETVELYTSMHHRSPVTNIERRGTGWGRCNISVDLSAITMDVSEHWEEGQHRLLAVTGELPAGSSVVLT